MDIRRGLTINTYCQCMENVYTLVCAVFRGKRKPKKAKRDENRLLVPSDEIKKKLFIYLSLWSHFPHWEIFQKVINIVDLSSLQLLCQKIWKRWYGVQCVEWRELQCSQYGNRCSVRDVLLFVTALRHCLFKLYSRQWQQPFKATMNSEPYKERLVMSYVEKRRGARLKNAKNEQHW